jgi:2-keto-4-pentenoate hydratase/2-oxohepta-3-ene-1,7-dioic acid hydratase in catechol pathway
VRIAAVRTSASETRLAAERDGERLLLDYDGGLEELLREGRDPREIAVLDAVDRSLPLAAPLRPGKVVAIGLNYMDHVRESGAEPPPRPLVFAKFPSSVIGPEEPIVIDRELTERVDWEVELAAVVGRRLRDASAGAALDAVLGWTVGNDVSARDVQFGDGQWVRGKSFDTFCPLGPAVVTADEVADPQALRLFTRVNGETVQDSSTAEMIFGAAELLAFCSRSFTLEPGDVLLTGTPWGCGEFMDPPRSLQPGDVVEVEVEGIGALRNPVIAAEPRSR